MSAAGVKQVGVADSRNLAETGASDCSKRWKPGLHWQADDDTLPSSDEESAWHGVHAELETLDLY